jgi:hypothetical protein
MGIQVSAPDDLLFESLRHDHSCTDTDYWSTLLVSVPSRTDPIVPNPSSLNHIALVRPTNFLNLALVCTRSFELFAERDPSLAYMESDLNRLSWALKLFTVTFHVLCYNPELFPLFASLDAGLANDYKAANPYLRKFCDFSPPPAQNGRKQSRKRRVPAHPLESPRKRSRHRIPLQTIELEDHSPEAEGVISDLSFQRMKGRCFESFAASFSDLIFKSGLTVITGCYSWGDEWPEPQSMLMTRRDLAHAFLGVISSDFFAWTPVVRPTFELLLPDFDLLRFLRSVCQISRHYSEDSSVLGLLKVCFALLTHIFTVSGVRQAFSELTPELLLGAFAVSRESATIFHPTSTISAEAVSFLFMASVSNSGFVSVVASRGYSNLFIYNLLYTGQLVYERVRYCHTHSILLSIILVFVQNPVIAENLNAPFAEPFHCAFRIPTGSYADFMLNIILNICSEEQFWPSVVLIFRFIAPYVTEFSVATAGNVLVLFETLTIKQHHLVRLLLEAFADILLQRVTGFSIALAYKTALFKRLEVDDPRCAQPLTAIRGYLVNAGRAIKASGKKRLTHDELRAVLGQLQCENAERPPGRKRFEAFRGEIEKTWGEWTDTLFIRSFWLEIQKMEELKQAYAATLLERVFE